MFPKGGGFQNLASLAFGFDPSLLGFFFYVCFGLLDKISNRSMTLSDEEAKAMKITRWRLWIYLIKWLVALDEISTMLDGRSLLKGAQPWKMEVISDVILTIKQNPV